MNPYFIIAIIVGYFGILMLISKFTSKNQNNRSFYLAERKSPWYLIAIGMIGSSISGVTFISVPGWVITSNFSYMQMVLGYVVGYFVIAYVLLPIYYQLNLTSIYTFLEERFNVSAYKTGAWLFLISRTIGSAFRLFIVSRVLQVAVFDQIGIPFWITVIITILLIWLYSHKGGIKTIIYTDVLQTFFLLMAAVLTVCEISSLFEWNLIELVKNIADSNYSKIFYFDNWQQTNYFWKHFLSGMFITIVMTGLDQDMMQKNLTCRTLKDAQKNMISYGLLFIPINLIFLSLGAILIIYSQTHGLSLPAKTDDLYPSLAFSGALPPIVSIMFIVGVIAAAYSSADSALTALTTSFTVDILNYSHEQLDTPRAVFVRKWVHALISAVMIGVIIVFNTISNDSVISAIFKVAGYTYGPLLGMFAFGIFNRKSPSGWVFPLFAILSPTISYILQLMIQKYSGYQMGFELLLLNGFITYCAIYLFSKEK